MYSKRKLRIFTCFLWMIAILWLIPSCKVYYDTSTVDNQLKSGIQNINDNCNRFKTSVDQLINQFKDLGCTSGTPEIQKANQLLNETKQLAGEMAQLQKEINAEYTKFQQYTQYKTKIESGTEEWKKLKTSKEIITKNTQSLQRKGDEAVKKATEFNKFCTEELAKTIQVCDVKQFNDQLTELVAKATSNEAEYDVQLEKADQQIANVVSQFQNAKPELCKTLRDELLYLYSIKDKLRTIKPNLQIAAKKFKLHSDGKSKIYSCSDNWKIIQQLETEINAQKMKMSEMNAEIQQHISSIQASLSSISPQ